MDNKGLLFIPDISGFTKFVTEMEIEHSRIIIQQLLELLIDANESGLEISEVEGDAILFYKFGASPPDIDAIYRQVEKMFCAFHSHLLAYELRRFCQCKACISAVNLSLKVITHYGEFTGYTVKNFSKLIGKDVIVAHQLLKNDIELHEYWLVTKNVADNPASNAAAGINWNASAKQTESGEIPFFYTHLGQLKQNLSPAPLSPIEIENKVKVATASREYDADMRKLFYTSAHFEFRYRWQQGVNNAEQLDHLMPAVGMRLKYSTDEGEKIIRSSSFIYDPESTIIFSETDEDRKSALYFTLEKINAEKSRLTIDYYISKNFLEQLLFMLAKKNKMEASLRQSLKNLDAFLKEIVLPVEF